MDKQPKKCPVSVAALDRTYRNESLRTACVVLVAGELFYSNAEHIYYTGGDVFDIISSAQRTLELASKPETHIGRTGATSQLAGFVEDGVLSKRDAQWLRYVAKLVAREGSLTIHPLFEVARRILAMHLAAGGFRG